MAEAAGTGTGGTFVPLQGRLVDTRDGTGGLLGPMTASAWTPFTVLGAIGIPLTNVSSVVINVTPINTTTSMGLIQAQANAATPIPSTGTFMVFNGLETVSNTGVITVAADGKIMIQSTLAIHVVIDVQGYFQTGNGSPAPGGFVPVTAQNVYSQAGVGNGAIVDVPLFGVAGIPDTATAVFANFTVTNVSTGTTNGYIAVYPTGSALPGTNLNFGIGTTSLGSTADLNSAGSLSYKIVIPAGATVTVSIDIYGYFDGQPTNASYNTTQAGSTTPEPLRR